MTEQELQSIENRTRTKSPVEAIVDSLVEEVRYLNYLISCRDKVELAARQSRLQENKP